MGVVVVGRERNVGALADRLLTGRASKATTEDAIRTLREANPGLDLDKLRPGTVVVVPPLRGSRVETGDVVAPPLDALLDQIATAVKSFAESADAALATDAAERDEAATVLRQLRTEPGWKESGNTGQKLIETLTAELKSAGQDAQAKTDAIRPAVEQWLAGLDALRGLI